LVDDCGSLVEDIGSLVEDCGSLVDDCGSLVDYYYGSLVDGCLSLVDAISPNLVTLGGSSKNKNKMKLEFFEFLWLLALLQAEIYMKAFIHHIQTLCSTRLFN
jgi:hypothetical protein